MTNQSLLHLLLHLSPLFFTHFTQHSVSLNSLDPELEWCIKRLDCIQKWKKSSHNQITTGRLHLQQVVPSAEYPQEIFLPSKPGSLRQPISFEDSPEWEDTDIDVRVDEGGDSINVATTPLSPTLSKLNSGSLPSPPLPEGAVVKKIVGDSIVWKDLTVTIKGKRKYSDNKVIRAYSVVEVNERSKLADVAV